MRRHTLIRILILTAALSKGGYAQFNSVPHFYDPTPTYFNQWTISVNPAFGLNDDSGKNFAFAARVSRDISRLTITAGISTLNPEIAPNDRKLKLQFMGNITMRVTPSPNAELEDVDYTSFKIDVISGFGYTSLTPNVSEWNIPLGIGVGYTFEPASGGWGITPWIAPRIAIRTLKNTGTSTTQVGFGFSLGINFGPQGGIGLFAAIDWISFGETTSGSISYPKIDPLTIGAGIRYRWGKKYPD